MDILLSHGYFLGRDAAERKVMKPYPPLGLLHLAADLERQGFQAGVYDSTFGSPADFGRRLERSGAPVVGLYANLTTRRGVLELMRICRGRGVRVVLGGPEPANYPRQYLERGADVIVVGEGELTLRELLPRMIEGDPDGWHDLQGICHRPAGGEVVTTPSRPFVQDLDILPWPRREAIDLERYLETWRRHHGYSAVSLITSRGCPYTCTWCSHAVYGYSHRSRSPGNVADEVEFIRERYRPDRLWYADDVFALNRRWFFEYAAELERRRLRVPFETISREDRLDDEVIRRLAEMGCRRLWIGAESGSQRILDAMQRRTDAERVVEMVQLLQRHRIEAGLFVMLGYEGEERADLEKTIDFLARAAPDTYLTTVSYPIRGTPYHDAVDGRIQPSRPWEESSDRDLAVAGRHSARYYRSAQRWMAGEVARRTGRGGWWGRSKAVVNSRLGDWGMKLAAARVWR